MARCEDAQLKFLLQSLQHFLSVRTNFEVDAILSQIGGHFYRFSPAHLLFLSVPVHHLRVDQRFVEIEDQRHFPLRVPWDSEGFRGFPGDADVDEHLKSSDGIEEVFEVRTGVFGVVGELENALFHIGDVVIQLLQLQLQNFMGKHAACETFPIVTLAHLLDQIAPVSVRNVSFLD